MRRAGGCRGEALTRCLSPVPCAQHKHIARSVSFARGDTAWQLCTGGAEKLLRIFDLQRPDAAPTGAGGGWASFTYRSAGAWLQQLLR